MIFDEERNKEYTPTLTKEKGSRIGLPILPPFRYTVYSLFVTLDSDKGWDGLRAQTHHHDYRDLNMDVGMADGSRPIHNQFTLIN